MDSTDQIGDTGQMDIDNNNDRMHNNEDSQIDDSIIQSNSPDTDEKVRNLIENSPNDVLGKSNFTIHDNSLSTDDVVRNLVESTIVSVEAAKNDSILDNSPNGTDKVVRNSFENTAEDTNIFQKDDILDSMLESIMDEDEDNNEPQDSVTVDDDPDFVLRVEPNKPADSSPLKNDQICRLPLGRIKTIIKADPDINIVSADNTFLMAKSCELFLQWLGKEVYSYTVQQKKKTIQKRDLDLAINGHPALEFLDGALD